MSIKRFVETIESPSYRYGVKGDRRHIRTFRVQTTLPNEDPAVIRAHQMCPRIGAVFNSRGVIDTAAVCNDVAINNTEAPTVRDVVATYGSPKPGENQLDSAEAIFSAPPMISTATMPRQETHGRDAAGNEYKNTLGDWLDPVPPREMSIMRLSIRRNERSYDPRVALSYTNTVNGDAWLGFAETEARCIGITADEAWENIIHYWIVRYEFEVKEAREVAEGGGVKAGWQPVEIINAGGRYLDPDTEKVTVVHDDMDTAFNGLVRLGIDSNALGRDEESYWLWFTPYKVKAFAPLGLP